MWNKIKNILIFVVIAGVLIAGYVLFMQKPKQAALVSTTTTPTNTETGVEDTAKLGQDFLNLLFSVKSINLDAAVFDTPTFGSLKDSSIILIPDGSEGRPNPFAPIGAENSLNAAQAVNDLLLGGGTPSTPVAPNTEKPQTTSPAPKKTN